MTTDAQTFAIIDNLPDYSYLKQYVQWAYTQTCAPAIYHVATALSHLAAVAPPDLTARMSVPIHANVYGLIVGESGSTKKTTSIVLGDQILASVVPQRIGPWPGSWEGLHEALEDQPSQRIAAPELGAFLAASSGNAATNYYAKLRTALTDVYDCTPINKRRAKGKRINIAKPRLSIIAATAQPFLERHTVFEDWTGGFMGRWMIAYGEPTDRDVADAPDLEGHVNWLKVKLDALHTAGKKPTQFVYVGLEPSIKAGWSAWISDVIERFDARTNPWARIAAARTPVVAMKAALLLSLDCAVAPNGEGGVYIRDASCLAGQPWRMQPDVLAAAMLLAEAHLDGLTRVVAQLSTNDYERDRNTILAGLREDTLAMGPLMQSLQPRMHAKRLASMLESMLIAEDIVRHDVAGRAVYQRAPEQETTQAPNVLTLDHSRGKVGKVGKAGKATASRGLSAEAAALLDSLPTDPEACGD